MPTKPSHPGLLISRQFALGEVRRRLNLEAETARREQASPTEGPWISVSKQLGTGGRQLAARLGERLGWPAYDREIIKEICHHDATREGILNHLDDRPVGVIEDYLRQLLVRDDPGQLAFLEEMVRVVWALAREGRAIFVGRGVNWLLEPRFGLRIRVIAPLEQRIAAIVEAQGLTSAEARLRLRDDDAAKASFVRQVYHHEIDDPLGYDLVLNLGQLDAATAVEVVMTALAHKVGLGEARTLHPR